MKIMKKQKSLRQVFNFLNCHPKCNKCFHQMEPTKIYKISLTFYEICFMEQLNGCILKCSAWRVTFSAKKATKNKQTVNQSLIRFVFLSNLQYQVSSVFFISNLSNRVIEDNKREQFITNLLLHSIIFHKTLVNYVAILNH